VSGTDNIDRTGFLIFHHQRKREWTMRSRTVPRETPMARMFVDCRDYPSEMNCTVAISADSAAELLDAAVQHAIAVHGHHDSPQLRRELSKMIKPQ
jgi:predicted small metal-binding protein